MIHQGNEKWHQDRCGLFTASRVDDILAIQEDKWKVTRPTGTTAKVCSSQDEADQALAEAVEKARVKEGWQVVHVPGEPLKSFQDYLAEVLCERLTGEPQHLPDTYQMAWGRDNEPHAVDTFEIITGATVKPCGFIAVQQGPLNGLFGASPDGLMDDGLIEVKCPANSVNHIRCFTEGVPEQHLGQIQGQLLATGKSQTVFISYDPRMPRHLQLFHQVVAADGQWFEKIQLGVLRAENALQKILEELPKEGSE